MAIKAVLFDLDGTLLPMDQDEFTKTYFKLLAAHLMPLGYEPASLVESIWGGTKAMIKNDGSCTNEEAFWSYYARVYGEDSLKDKPYIDAFYQDKFNQVQAVCGYAPQAKEIVSLVRERGKLPVLATNPLFPQMATKNRIRWAGLEPEDFVLYTTYENAHYCKPNLKYYEELLETLDCKPQECIMVGNDVGEDMITENLGMQVFLLKDCMINRGEQDISRYPQGDFAALREFLEQVL